MDGSNLKISILITVCSTIYRRRYKKIIFHPLFFKVLKMMVGSNLKEDQLQQIVDKTILQVTNNIFLFLFYQFFGFTLLAKRFNSDWLSCQIHY